jgi:acetyltransferase-like isoleucine patch superfamily enzyme
VNNNLLILGAGQYGAVVREIAESMGKFDKINFLDDNLPDVAIGSFSDCARYISTYSYAIVAIGNPDIRCFWIDRLEKLGYKIPVLVHKNAFVSPSAFIESGTIVEPMAVIQAHVHVGRNCLICSGAVLKHNCIVGDACYVDCNSAVMPEASVPSGMRVNCNSVYFFRN